MELWFLFDQEFSPRINQEIRFQKGLDILLKMLDRYLSNSTEPYAKIYPEQRAVTGLFSYKLIDEGLDGLIHRKNKLLIDAPILDRNFLTIVDKIQKQNITQRIYSQKKPLSKTTWRHASSAKPVVTQSFTAALNNSFSNQRSDNNQQPNGSFQLKHQFENRGHTLSFVVSS